MNIVSYTVTPLIPWVTHRQGGCLECWRLQWSIPAEAALIYTMPQRLPILRKSWRVFHDRSLLVSLSGFVLPILEYCSAVWCSAADTHLKLLDGAVSRARFLSGGVFECDIARRRSVAIDGSIASSLKNLAVSQDFYSSLSVPLERSLLTAFSIVWDWRVSRAVPMLFYWPKLLSPYYSLLLFFPFSSFCLYVGIVGLMSSDW